MTITQQPSSLNFSGNLPDIIIKDLSAKIELKLSDASGSLLVESYSPYNGAVKIRLRDIIHSLLSIEIPVYENPVFVQTKGFNTYTVTLTSGGSIETITFTVIKSFLQRSTFDVELFVKQNWLTFQPREKLVEFHDPEWLACFPLEPSTVKVEATFADQTTELITYTDLEINKLQCVNVQPGEIIGLFSQESISFTVWIESSNQIRQYKKTYYIKETIDTFFNDVFLFENRLGGLDTIRYTGQKKFDNNTEIENALFDEFNLEYFAQPNLRIEKNTGFFRSERERAFALDFFRSSKKYHILDGSPARITTSNLSLENIPGQLASYSFNFQYSDFTNAFPEYGTAGQNTLTFSN